jgi:uncharacterized protein (DUF58 family)
MRVLREILYHQPESKKTDLTTAARYLYTLLKKRSIIFIISDFYTQGYENDLKILAKKHDVVAIQIIDRMETELPKVGLLNIVDPETGQTLTINTFSSKIRDEFKDKIAHRQTELQEQFNKIKVDLITLKTRDNYVTELLKFFKRSSSIRKN